MMSRACSLLLLILLPALALAADCTDFSGRYLGVDGDSDFMLEFAQEGCREVRGQLTYLDSGLSFAQNMVFDDQFHLTWDSGTSSLYEKHRIDAGVISYVQEYRFSGGKVMRTVGKMAFDAAGDLVDEQDFFDESGAPDGHLMRVYHRRK
jgi:hypothetical protein